MPVFRMYDNAGQAFEMATWLAEKGIAGNVEEVGPKFDVSFSNNPLLTKYALLIPSDDFPSARALLLDFYQRQLSSVPSNYYLFSFTIAELQEIILKPDEWGDLDYALSRKLLTEKGLMPSEENLTIINHSRAAHLADEEQKDSSSAVFMGFLLAFTTGFFGFVIGWHLAYSNMTLPDGTQLLRYDDVTRRRGRIIMTIGIIITIGILAFAIFNSQHRLELLRKWY